MKVNFLNDQTIYCPGQAIAGECQYKIILMKFLTFIVIFRSRYCWDYRDKSVQRYVFQPSSLIFIFNFLVNQKITFSLIFIWRQLVSKAFSWPISSYAPFRPLNWFFFLSLSLHRTLFDVYRFGNVQIQRLGHRCIFHERVIVHGSRAVFEWNFLLVRIVVWRPERFRTGNSHFWILLSNSKITSNVSESKTWQNSLSYGGESSNRLGIWYLFESFFQCHQIWRS